MSAAGHHRLRTHGGRRVLLTEQLNAAISRVPLLGVLGWQRNTLILGMPLLSLSPGQARAVLAHELGHLSSNHSGFNAWIYRVRASWWRIMDTFDQAQGWSVGLLRRSFDWYAPYFNAYSFALARANEYEADAISAELTSNGIAPSDLAREGQGRARATGKTCAFSRPTSMQLLCDHAYSSITLL